MGYRYRLHAKELPGKPDIVFRSRKAAIFVHGCFWHLHGVCREGRIPNSNRDYWSEKLNRNVARDYENRRQLEKLGWRVLELWECEIKDREVMQMRIKSFLGKETEKRPY